MQFESSHFAEIAKRESSEGSWTDSVIFPSEPDEVTAEPCSEEKRVEACRL